MDNAFKTLKKIFLILILAYFVYIIFVLLFKTKFLPQIFQINFY